MRYRILVLPLAAAIIASLTAYKLSQRPQPRQTLTADAARLRPAPPFQIPDQNSRTQRLQRYLGRHKILVVFFDPGMGADLNPQLRILKADLEGLKATGAYVFAISIATPYANRMALQRERDQGTVAPASNPKSPPRVIDYPFPLLSDPTLAVHQGWGAFDGREQRPLPGVFVVDRSGLIRWSRVGEDVLVDAATLIQELNRAP